MAAATVRKLIVEVSDARDLIPKDGHGTSSPYVIVDFDGQRKRTQMVQRDLNPNWNEVLVFDVSGPIEMAGEPLEVDVLHDRRVGPHRRNNFLGRVRLDARQFVKKGEEALIYFPLQKKSLFNWVRGEIGLKIYYVDEAAPVLAAPPEGEKPNEPAAAPTVTDDDQIPPKTAEIPATQEAKPEEPPATTDAESGAAEPAPPPVDSNNPETPAEPPNTESEIPPPPEIAPDPENLTQPDPALAEVKGPESEAQPEIEPSEDADESLPPPIHSSPPEFKPIPRQMPVPRPRRPVKTPDDFPVERSTFDLVEKMHYLFVRIVRARSLPTKARPHVRIAASGHHAATGPAWKTAFFEWDQTFAFPRADAGIADSSQPLEVSVWDLPPSSDTSTAAAGRHFLGGVCFDVSDIPTRDPPDSPLATQWYRLEGGGSPHGDLMLATWIGTQADESYHDAWKAGTPNHVNSRSKVYLAPKLWYLRLSVLEAQDLPLLTPSREATVSVRATLGFQLQKTRVAVSRNGSPTWNEDLLFVAGEPFGDQPLVLSLETRQGKETVVLGVAGIPLSSVERRVDDRKVASRWLDLLPHPGKAKPAAIHAGRLNVRACLDGGYHVADEPATAASDYRPSARQLWGPPVGTVELGIIGCKGLSPVKAAGGKGMTDAYAVAKYGPKWARTRTIADSFDPTWNEQYTWEVYDPCTVLTVGVFDDGGDDSKSGRSCPMGRIWIRISTLECGRAYRNRYPLLLLSPSGVRKMGELELAVRFARAGSKSCLLQVYGQPMLPLMHHVRPISAAQKEPLRSAAARVVAAHLARSEPSLRKEVVLYMLDVESGGFSMRKVRANWHRIVGSLTWAGDVARWAEDTRAWRSTTATVLAHAVLVLLVWYPGLVAPAATVHVSLVGAWRYRRRSREAAGGACVRASQLEAAEREELEEEFDGVPSGAAAEAVRARYDRLRAVAARVQGKMGDVAAQGERLQALVTWRDPRATGIFVGFCVMVSVVLFVVPLKIVAVGLGFYWLRHPMFRDRRPSLVWNFFRRLPTLSDRMM